MELNICEIVDLVFEAKRLTELELRDKIIKENDVKPKRYVLGFEVSYYYCDVLDNSKGAGFHLIYADDEHVARREVVDYIKKVALENNLECVENLITHRWEFRIGGQLHYFIKDIRVKMVTRREV